jgi:hypothetical protein
MRKVVNSEWGQSASLPALQNKGFPFHQRARQGCFSQLIHENDPRYLMGS